MTKAIRVPQQVRTHREEKELLQEETMKLRVNEETEKIVRVWPQQGLEQKIRKLLSVHFRLELNRDNESSILDVIEFVVGRLKVVLIQLPFRINKGIDKELILIIG